MFNNSSHIDASHSTFSEVHRDQYFNARTTVEGNQTINTVVYGNQIHQDAHSILIESLQKASAPSAAHDSAQRYPAPKCIEGTRVELLARLGSWVDDPDQKPLCWLNGRPGSGKSAVSQTMAEIYAEKGRLAASFFFSRRDLERRTTQHVIPTLAMQLLASLPSIRFAVVAALEKDCMLPMKVLREQMEKLLLGPVSTAKETPEIPLLIVVDALDECDEENLVLELVTLLALLPQQTSLPLRLLITSRSEPWLQARFRQSDISALTLPLEIHTFSAEADIRSFLRRALDNMYDEHLHVMKDVPRPWPSPDELDRIVSKASGLFIFALTVVKFVGDKMHNPIQRLQAILGDKDSVSTESAYADLDSLYLDAIAVFPDPDVARLVLGVVYCMAMPLSISGLHHLLQRPDADARIVVPALSSVLLASEDGRQPIQFYHASFRDFLINPQRSRKYAINPDVYHRLMAQLCLQTMSNSLKRDMCGIADPARANKEVPDLVERRRSAFDEALLYACRFWSRHLARLPTDGVASEALVTALKSFSTTALLCWIEALSIFGELESAVVMLRESINWVKTLRDVPEDVLTLLQDADRLVVLFMEPISQCALHAHLTGILFTPRNSAIYRSFKDQSYGKIITYTRQDGWGAVRRELDLHHPIYCTVFSLNDRTIATAGASQGVQIWNAVTGGNVASFGGHSSTALLVCFSPSGAFLAAAFEGGTVAVWDPKVGREHLKHEGCHSETIMCIEFSKNNALLASGARDRVIQVWSVETAQPLYRLATHEGPVTALVFSCDSLRLFSASEDNLVMAWDMSSGRLVHGMTGHHKMVTCIDVSKDGSILASGSEDKTVKLWDTHSGKCTQTLSKGHHSGIRTVHFGEDKHLITACDNAILSWNITNRKTPDTIWDVEEFFKRSLKTVPAWQSKVVGWTAPKPMLRYILHKIATEPDSQPERLRTAFASRSSSLVLTTRGYLFGGPIQIPMDSMPISAGNKIDRVAVSSDGNWAVTAGPSGTLQILDLTIPRTTWEDTMTAAKLYPPLASNILIPSSTGTRFVCDGIAQWLLVDENLNIVKKLDMGMLSFTRDDDDIRLRFSADGSIFFCIIVSRLNDDKSTLRVFDSMTGEQRVQFSGLKKVQSFVSSANGAFVACGSTLGHVEVFGIANKERMSMEETENSIVSALSFSDDAQELLGGFENGVVRVWDRVSGTCKATFVASTPKVTALAYSASSPGGSTWIAIGREDGSVGLWAPLQSASHDILRGEQATVKNVDFIKISDDRSRLTSRCDDGTAFTWAISFDAGDVDMVRCMSCTGDTTTRLDQDRNQIQHQSPEGAGGKDASNAPPPHLLSRSDPGDAVDSLFHTAYRVRKSDGWLVRGDRRVIWLPPSTRPSGKDVLWAFDSGLVVFFTPRRKLVFFKWIDGRE